MNVLTKQIKKKGYSLTEFCEMHLMSLRSYRRWEKKCHANYDVLVAYIDLLDDKGDL